MQHRLTALNASLLAACLSLAAHGAAQAQNLSYIGQQIVPTGTVYQSTTIGGLSGIDYIASTGQYIAISDDRSAINPARYYGLALDLSQFTRSATPGNSGVSFQSVTTILQSGGTPYAANTLDPESIRVNPNNGALVWTNEGQRSGTFQNPTVREMTTGGSYLRDYSVPSAFLPVGSAAGTASGDAGINNNLAFENLTFSTDGKTLYTATENGLVQDSPSATPLNGSLSRILAFDATTGQAGAQYVYNVTPVVLPPQPAGQFATNGLVEMLATGDRQFIAMERSFAIGAASPGIGPNGLPTGYTVRLYAVDARGATDVSALNTLAGASYTAVTKTLLLDLSDLRNDDGSALALDNLEGMTLGPVVDGKQTLVLVSDNNFGSTQFTQFVALSISAVPEPMSATLLAMGLAGVLVAARRRR
jgi:hypothetical protein